MTDDIRQLLAALGAALVSAFGDTAPAPVPAEPKPAPAAQPAPMKGKRAPMPRKEKTCIVCGKLFPYVNPSALLCSRCCVLRSNRNPDFLRLYIAAKKKLAAGGEVPAPAPAPHPVHDDTFDCPRMHARIRPDFCGSRDECWNGKPCEKTAGKTRSEGVTKPWMET